MLGGEADGGLHAVGVDRPGHGRRPGGEPAFGGPHGREGPPVAARLVEDVVADDHPFRAEVGGQGGEEGVGDGPRRDVEPDRPGAVGQVDREPDPADGRTCGIRAVGGAGVGGGAGVAAVAVRHQTSGPGAGGASPGSPAEPGSGGVEQPGLDGVLGRVGRPPLPLDQGQEGVDLAAPLLVAPAQLRGRSSSATDGAAPAVAAASRRRARVRRERTSSRVRAIS